MRSVQHDDYTEIFLEIEEVMKLCRPGEMENTCVWLAAGVKGFECLYYNRRGKSLAGGTLEERWRRGLTNAKRDGCDIVRALVKDLHI